MNFCRTSISEVLIRATPLSRVTVLVRLGFRAEMGKPSGFEMKSPLMQYSR